MRILFYISGHGYGHATRDIALINAILQKAPLTDIQIRSKAPKILFESLPSSVKFYDTKIDVGTVEKDIFSVDVEETQILYSDFIDSKNEIIEKEKDFVSSEKIELIVSDIPPIASDIGKTLKLPVIALGNFSWDFIYKRFSKTYPAFIDFVMEIRASYRKTDLLLKLPFHHNMDAFPNSIDIPIIVRQSNYDREKILSTLGIDYDIEKPLILLALRIPDQVSKVAIQELIDCDEYIIISSSPLPFDTGGKVIPIKSYLKTEGFPSLVESCNLVISKLGYGIVSECIAGKTPLMYIPRDDFSEFDIIRASIQNFIPSYMLPRNDFIKGSWYKHIKGFISMKHIWPSIRTDGASVAADLILSYK